MDVRKLVPSLRPFDCTDRILVYTPDEITYLAETSRKTHCPVHFNRLQIVFPSTGALEHGRPRRHTCRHVFERAQMYEYRIYVMVTSGFPTGQDVIEIQGLVYSPLLKYSFSPLY